MIQSLINPRPSLLPTDSHYVVMVPEKTRNGVVERPAYGLSIPLTKRAAEQIKRAVQPLYPHGKTRAIMVKTALKSKVLA